MERKDENKINTNTKDKRNIVEMKVISDGFSLQSINLMYSGCRGTQNNRPTPM